MVVMTVLKGEVKRLTVAAIVRKTTVMDNLQ